LQNKAKENKNYELLANMVLLAFCFPPIPSPAIRSYVPPPLTEPLEVTAKKAFKLFLHECNSVPERVQRHFERWHHTATKGAGSQIFVEDLLKECSALKERMVKKMLLNYKV